MRACARFSISLLFPRSRRCRVGGRGLHISIPLCPDRRLANVVGTNLSETKQMAYSHGKVTVRQRLEGLYDVAASSFGDIEVALGLVDEDEEDSDIDF